MARVLVTGMSGTGKSTPVTELARRGYRVVDVDFSHLSAWDPVGEDGAGEWLWRRVALAGGPDGRSAGGGGQGHPLRRRVCLEPGDVLRPIRGRRPVECSHRCAPRRVASRTTNDYGKDSGERARIVSDLERFEPRLRATSTHELDATRSVAEVADALVAIGEGLTR